MEPNLYSQAGWSVSKKIVFRFFCCFFLLYIFPFPLSNIPFGTEIDKISKNILAWYYDALDWVTGFWHWFIPLVGKNVIHLKNPITIFTNGSGDTTYDYILLFTQIVLAFFIAALWSIIDSKRKSYNVAYYWLCVLIRYYLAGMMLVYGFIKVFHLQMPYPNLGRLVEPYGDSSPMGLAWTYVGQSKAFSILVGWSEVVCGLLLLFRKTLLLGALFSLIVMGNIVIINFCYDIPVKLFSSVLELMALYLAAPELKKLYQIFVQHKAIQVGIFPQPLFKRKWFAVTAKAWKFLLIADALFYGVKSNIDAGKEYGDYAPKPPLYGIYNTELVIKNNDTIPPLTTDTARWRQLIIQFNNYASVKMMNDTIQKYNFKVDTVNKTALVFLTTDTLNKGLFSYQREGDYLTMSGRIKRDSLYMKLKRFDEKQFRLMSRGFHWINEFPYNR